MTSSSFKITILVILTLSTTIQADWWDGLTEKVSNGLVGAADWVKETASPTIRDKFNEYKETLQDPETHKTIRQWLSEKADAASEFTQTEVLPELKKIYNAATADSKETTEFPNEEGITGSTERVTIRDE